MSEDSHLMKHLHEVRQKQKEEIESAVQTAIVNYGALWTRILSEEQDKTRSAIGAVRQETLSELESVSKKVRTLLLIPTLTVVAACLIFVGGTYGMTAYLRHMTSQEIQNLELTKQELNTEIKKLQDQLKQAWDDPRTGLDARQINNSWYVRIDPKAKIVKEQGKEYRAVILPKPRKE